MAVLVICFVGAQSFIQASDETVGAPCPKLSDYNIYNGAPSNLIPSPAFSLYELSSTLFSDYAEKQRLISIPAGTKLKAVDDGLPVFPDGTILAKTFYYYNDNRDTSKGKRIIETRIMVKAGPLWNAATYVWNAEQTDAFLASAASTISIKWINEDGSERKVAYNIPSSKQCGTCHRSESTHTLRDAAAPSRPWRQNTCVVIARAAAAETYCFGITYATNDSRPLYVGPS